MLRHGWRTGAIVPELETETKMVNTEQYSQALTWLQALTGLLERMQVGIKIRMLAWLLGMEGPRSQILDGTSVEERCSLSNVGQGILKTASQSVALEPVNSE